MPPGWSLGGAYLRWLCCDRFDKRRKSTNSRGTKKVASTKDHGRFNTWPRRSRSI